MVCAIALEGIISYSVFHFHEDGLIFRFHELSHTFSTTALEHEMDGKTLSTMIGHVSTTLNIYAHVTDEMRRTAAAKIDQGIGKTELQAEHQSAPRKPAPSTFHAHKGQRRKGGITQINEKLWEGRYSPIWPDGKSDPGTSMNTARKSMKSYWQR